MAKEAKKTAREASNLFHNIMKASVTDNTADCPTCGLKSQYVPPTRTEGKTMYINFKCPEGHIFTKETAIK